MRDPLHFVSVRYKLALMFLGLCLIAFGLGGYLVSSSAREALEGEIMERLSFQCRAYATALESGVRLASGRAEDFASDGYIRELTERLGGWEPDPDPGPAGETRGADDATVAKENGVERGSDSAAGMARALQRHLLVNKLPLAQAFAALTVLDTEGHVLASTHGDPAAIARSRAGARIPLDGPVLGELLPGSPDSPAPGLVLATPLRDLSGERLVGRLLVDLHLGVWLAQALASTRTGSESGGLAARLVLADGRGGRLEVPAGFARRAGPDSTLARESLGLRLAGDSGQATPGLLPRRGEFRKSYPVAGTDWHVEVSIGSDEALAPVSGLQSRYLGVGILLASLCALLLFFPMRFLARPLVELEQAARRMAQGHVSTRVPVTSSDEIGALAAAFNSMAEAVEVRTRRLETSATELRTGQRALRAERDRLDTVIRSLHDGLVVLDGEGRVVLSNQAAGPLLDVLARRGAPAESHQPCQHSPESSASACLSCLTDVHASPRSCLIDAGRRVLEVHRAPIPRLEGGRAGSVLVSRDVTDRLARDEREIHQERLAVLGEVGAVMAHELNNPLASISMFNQLLAAALPEGSPLTENVEVIRRNVESCTATIRDLLDYATDSSPEVDAIDVHDTLDDVARFLRPLAERNNVHVERRLEAADAIVSGDELQLRQVFVNLVMNAVQAMPRGGTVELSTRVADGMLEVCVKDDGPGIPQDLREQVFRPFFTTKSRGEGTGLGLSTARRIAELQGGGLSLRHSGPGETLFVVRLRLRGAVRPSGQAKEQVA